MNSFDPDNMGLDGYALVEASAGTGKTYGITSLYLRLIMEEGLLPGQILVVTFTKAATEELKIKIRERLQGAFEYVKGGRLPENDTFLAPLVNRLKTDGIDESTILGRIKEALLRLDEAAVFTIHGFCQRMLREFAFESGTAFESEVIASENDLYYDAVKEFMRSIIYEMPESHLKMVLRVLGSKAGSISEALHDVCRILVSMPRPALIPEPLELNDAIALLEKRAKAMQNLSRLYKKWGEEYFEFLKEIGEKAIEDFLSPLEQCAYLSRAIPISAAKKKMLDIHHGNIDSFRSLLSDFKEQEHFDLCGLDMSLCEYTGSVSADYLSECWQSVVAARGSKKSNAISPDLTKDMKETIGQELANIWNEEGIKGYNTVPENLERIPFHKALVDFLHEFKDADAKFEASLLAAVRDFTIKEVRRKKRRLSLLSYDDMIEGLKNALCSRPEGKGLAATIRRHFKVALIDEFQDTDSMQWAIFSAIYPDAQKDRLYLIGDPKQAIYGFRGADIFTYLQAKKAVPTDRHFSLVTNWRSNPQLIGAVNAVFDQPDQDNPFILEGIEYFRVDPKEKGHKWLEIDGEGGRIGVEFWEPVNEASEKDTALIIAGLLGLGREGKARIVSDEGDPESLGAGHIAVLVGNYWEAESIRQELANLRIPSVYYGKSSVFKAPEATDMLYILNAVLSPSSQSALNTALGTVTLGYLARDLAELKNHPDKWNEIVDTFADLKGIWHRDGVMPMLMSLFDRFDVPRRLLAFRGGQRALTNLRQLADLLEKAEAECPGPEYLCLWLRENISSPDMESDEQQLRLETDENVVKIMTYHRSKGLEFPVLFLPFINDLKARFDERRYYHERKGSYVYDCLGQWQEEVESEDECPVALQANAEAIRLFYVAMTRAQCRLYMQAPKTYYEVNEIVSGLLVPSEGDMDDYYTNNDDGHNAVDCSSRLVKLDLVVEERLFSTETEEVKAGLNGVLKGVEGVNFLSADELAQKYGFSNGESVYVHALSSKPRHVPKEISRIPLAPWTWRQLSFTTITLADEGIVHGPLMACLEGLEKAEEASNPLPDSFGFPRGATAGNCIHSFFENIPFDADDSSLKKEAVACVSKFGIGDEWASVLARMGRKVLNAELVSGLRLADLSEEWVAKEMGFYLSVSRDELAGFEHLFPELQRGTMKGYIDLFFVHDGSAYILDYKSNWLGQRPEDYGQEAMQAAMDQHNYWLQAAIYLDAVERFLKIHAAPDREINVASVFYLFVRGVGADRADPGLGILSIGPETLKDRYPHLFGRCHRRAS